MDPKRPQSSEPCAPAETPGFSGLESGFRRDFSPVVVSLWSLMALGAVPGTVKQPLRRGPPRGSPVSLSRSCEQDEPWLKGESAEGQDHSRSSLSLGQVLIGTSVCSR